ncbi:amino acid adenylation domain-containing protein [Sorangium sp. So ce134]
MTTRHDLTSVQQAIWLDQMLAPGVPSYNIGMAFRIDGDLDEARFEAAVGHVVQSHDALRLVIGEEAGVPFQRVLPRGGGIVPVLDLTGHEDAEARAWAHIQRAASTPFELYGRPLWEAQLVRIRPDCRYFRLHFHHLVSDGTHFAIVVRAIAEAYERCSRGAPVGAPAPSYLEFAEKDRQYLTSPRYEEDRQFWTERFVTLPPPLLSSPRAIEAMASGRDAWVSDRVMRRIEGHELARLRAYLAASGSTLQHFLLAVLATYFARTHGAEEVVIGVSVHNRGTARDRRTAGMFSSMIPLGIRVHRDKSIDELMQDVATELRRCYRHQRFPIQDLNRSLRLDQLGRRQLFDVTLSLDIYPEVAPIGAARWAVVDKMYSGFAQVPLAVCINEYPGTDNAVIELDYSRVVFERGEIERIQRRLACLMNAVLEGGAGQPIGALPLIDEDERRQVVVGWNETATAYPTGLRVHELFEAQVARTPAAVAVDDGARRLPYAELNARANQLAHALRRQGVGPDVPVGLCLERSVEMVIGLLAVLKAGGCYVPLDPDQPKVRLREMIADSAPRVVLVDAVGDRTLAEVEGIGARCVALSMQAWGFSREPCDAPPAEGHERDLAYVIYTSGSTGTPKGVMNEHRGVVNRLLWMQQAYGLGERDVVLQKTPFGFDVSVWELFWPLMAGAQLVMARPHGHKDPDYLATLIERARVTTLHFVPSMLQAFLAEDVAERCTSLVRVFCSGEALPAPLVRRFHDRLPGIELHNLYGPTEAAVDVTAWQCRPGETSDAIPIGRPIANTQIYILDERRQPVPVGAPGELYIGGVQVARGYLNQPALTSARFVDDPFTAGGRLYRTGDLGRWRSDGAIEYLGRNDLQVKIRGVRIELGEIEVRLAEVMGLREVAVTAREDEPGDLRLVAYYTAEGEQAPDAEALRAHAAQRLPAAAVPAAYVRLAAMPVTANGKLDRKALPAPDAAAFAHRAYEPPQGATEQTLAGIWAELLGIERVGRHDNFFALGGHSLIAIRLIERMRSAHMHADVRGVFSAPTLAALASQVGADSDEVAVPPNLIPPDADRITPEMLPLVSLSQASIDAIVAAVDGGAAGVQDIYALAPLQEGILFHHLVRSPDDADPYVMSGVFGFASRARLDRFLKALQQVIDRHDILRTAVAWQGLVEQPVQVVHRRATLEVEVVALDPDAGDIVAQLEAGHDARIDVTRPPLFRGRVAADPTRGRWLLHLLFHHLVLDHTTLETVLAEARAIEDGQRDLPAPAPFRDFVAQARSRVSASEHEAFFREMLGDVDAPTAPFGLLDVHGDGSGIAEASRTLSAELARAVRERARALGVSTASLFHLAWALVLARTTDRRDVVFGTVLVGRAQGGARADRALGVFINTLPIRIDVDARGVADAARGTHARIVELLRHEHAPLALAQRASAIPSQAPLFTSLLNYRFSADDSDVPSLAHVLGSEIELLASRERTNYPLGLTIDDLGQALVLTAKAPREVGPERICDFVQTALHVLVHALATEPARPVCELDVLPASERERVLASWNDTAIEVPRGASVHGLFEAQVARTPRAIAVVHGDIEVTFAELDARANCLAQALRAHGVGPDRRVAIVLERGVDMIVAVLGILKAGGAYVPLDPSLPPARLAQVLVDAGPVCVISQAALRASLPSAPPVILLAAGGANIALAREMADARLDETVSDAPGASSDPARQLAYVIYTSGSTGRPKGVMVEHGSVVNLWAALERAIHAHHPHCRRVSLNAPLAFDSSVKQWVQLLSGRTLVVVPADVRADGAALRDFIAAHEIDVLDCTPSQLALTLDERGAPRCAVTLVGGEAISPAQWHALVEHGPTTFYNVYGPTECTVDATVARISGGAPHIGRPIANVRVYVVDALFRPSPVGVIGEIVIGGAGVGRGYLGEPGLTAERFVDDPFVSGGRVYRTGDLGRWRADGTIEYVGRNDFQVKLRGYRIELGEIEARLGEVRGVGEVVVVARREGGDASDARLVAYYTGEGNLAEALRAHASRSLPSYMVPTAYVALEALPLTAHGKVDRGALPAPEASEARRGEGPRNQIEELLAGLWSELLGREQVSRSDHFFELGGHSLLAMQLVSRVRRLLGVELALSEVFAHPELHGLAARVRVAERTELPEIAVGERRGPEPVSLTQQRLWFLTRLEGASAAYHIRGAFRLRGELDRGALVGALRRIVERHESLRTRFGVQDGVPVQDVQATAALQLREEDVRGSADAAAAARALGDAHAAAAFELSEELPLRVLVVRTGEDEHVLEVVMHHIASDGWSVGVFLRELSALYGAYVSGRADPLAAPTVQYADWAAWQRSALASGQLARQSEFWRSNLCGAPSLLSLPWDRPRPAQQDPAGASIDVEVGAELTRGLRALSRRHGVTMYMTLLASWGAVLSRLSGQEEVVIGSPVAGRGRAEIESLIGFFVNTLALRIDLQGEPTVGEVLARTRAQVLAAQEHQDLPFDQVVEVVAPPRSLSHTPLYQVMLDWHGTRDAPLTLPGLDVTTLPTELDTAQCDLTLALQEREEGLVGSLNYATALFERETVERYRGYWLRVLEGMVADDRQPIGAIAVLSRAEWQRVVVEWNDTERALPLERCVHELFEAQVARAPEAVAVDDGAERLSYGELNRRANRLARHLREVGVTADARVGVCAERGAPVLVALLATLKAGGAYVPLDPAYPGERLAHIIEDSAPIAVLTAGGAGRDVARRHVPGTVAVVDVELDAGQWASRRDDDLDARALGVGAEHLAYVIYTSGSSGQPKGVMIEHRNLVNYTLAAIEWFGLGPADTVLQQNSLNFDLSLEEIMPALLAGARLLPRSRPFGAGDEGERASVVHLTAAHWHSLVGEWSRPGAGAPPLDGVRLVNVTGDALSPHALARWEALGAQTRLINTYGPTEVTVSCSAAYVRHEAGAARVSIGKPFANTRMYVLDRRGEPVPVGVVGELFIAGAQVGRGYLHQPQRSAERFVEDRFHPGRRMYRSGDLARWRPDGELEFIGRDDGQVKVRGFRVELGEVESALAQLPGLDEVAVLVREDVSGDKRLVAYYAGAAALDDDALRRHAAEKLPAYMLPAAYVRLAALPLTPNGKLDRKALPAPEAAAFGHQAYEAPQGAIEQTLAEIWAELLGVEQVGRNDNFFALGGHSLIAIRLIERMRRARMHADVTAIFLTATLSELAAQVRASADEPNAPPRLIARHPGGVRDPDAAFGLDVEEIRL